MGLHLSPARDLLLTADTVVAPHLILRPGWIKISGDVVVGTGSGVPAGRVDLALGARIVVPGFVDMHVHGGGGGAFPSGDPVSARVAVAFHRRHGTTTSVASLVAAGPDELLRGVSVLADLVDEGLLAGTHLEGPWIAGARGGAHDRSCLRDPDPAELDRLLTAARGTIAMVTLAPERRGGLEAVRRIRDSGAVVAIGHTDATYDQSLAAIHVGATVGTHLFNAMRPVHQREPGPVVALLEDPRVTVELITDGVHLHPALYRAVCHAAGPDRVALVTDAIAAAGMPDGVYQLGAVPVTVTDGVARTATGGIAGSTATMDRIFRYAIQHSGLPSAQALRTAVRLTSANPAAALGLTDVGSLAPGASADLVVLDSELTVWAVMARGGWVEGPPAPARCAPSPGWQ